MKIKIAAFDSPIGKLALAVGPEGLLRLDLRGDTEAMEDGLRFAIREVGRTVGAGVVSKVIE